MPYDKEKRRITIEGGPGKGDVKQFDEDLVPFFKDISAQVTADLKAEKKRERNRALRVGLAAAASWAVGVLAYSAVMEPFGSLRYDSSLEKTLAVAFVPALVGTLVYCLFRWALKTR